MFWGFEDFLSEDLALFLLSLPREFPREFELLLFEDCCHKLYNIADFFSRSSPIPPVSFPLLEEESGLES